MVPKTIGSMKNPPTTQQHLILYCHSREGGNPDR
jgi:hypothetical protein